jgi:hypothetical protein
MPIEKSSDQKVPCSESRSEQEFQWLPEFNAPGGWSDRGFYSSILRILTPFKSN